MNSILFAEFLRESLVGYSGYYLILDNVSFHKSKIVVTVLQEAGVKPIFIDPYTPEQNPIEEVFSSVKAYVKRMSPKCKDAFHKRLRTAMRRQRRHVLTKYFLRSVNYRD
jgi:transposase